MTKKTKFLKRILRYFKSTKIQQAQRLLLNYKISNLYFFYARFYECKFVRCDVMIVAR